ncbi:hypothetical protein, partial [Ligaoa zhengdingensis]|uniref:hypothetical protein n=1 Tax=Ligaoa zhengdingensis TaxID=2763658 RepID=UPI0031B9EED5
GLVLSGFHSDDLHSFFGRFNVRHIHTSFASHGSTIYLIIFMPKLQLFLRKKSRIAGIFFEKQR